MLNPFPIQFLALFAYLILRVFVGTILIHLGLAHARQRAALATTLSSTPSLFSKTVVVAMGLAELAIGLLLLLGAFTQYASLALMALCAGVIIFRRRLQHPSVPPAIFYTLLLGCASTLFITGAGALAFDLPL